MAANKTSSTDKGPWYIIGVFIIVFAVFYAIYWIFVGRKKRKQVQEIEKQQEIQKLKEKEWIIAQIDNYTNVNGMEIRTYHLINSVNGKKKKLDSMEGTELHKRNLKVGEKIHI